MWLYAQQTKSAFVPSVRAAVRLIHIFLLTLLILTCFQFTSDIEINIAVSSSIPLFHNTNLQVLVCKPPLHFLFTFFLYSLKMVTKLLVLVLALMHLPLVTGTFFLNNIKEYQY